MENGAPFLITGIIVPLVVGLVMIAVGGFLIVRAINLKRLASQSINWPAAEGTVLAQSHPLGFSPWKPRHFNGSGGNAFVMPQY